MAEILQNWTLLCHTTMHNSANTNKKSKWQFVRDRIKKSHQNESEYKRSNKVLHLLINSTRQQSSEKDGLMS